MYKLLPDIAILILYFFAGEMMSWQSEHAALSATLLMILNIAAVGLGCFSFFSMYAEQKKIEDYKNSLSKFQSSLIGLCVFVSCIGFLWWLVPFAGLKEMGVNDTGFFIGLTVYFITFIAAVAIGISYKTNTVITERISFKVITSFVTVIFFFFAYCLLKMTMQHWHPGLIAGKYSAAICLCVFYLPLRFFLLMRPPFSKLEYLGFVFSFGWLMVELFRS